MKKRDYINIIILLGFSLLVILGIFLFGNIFGANMDWINQHTVIPEYFRQYFYETKKLVPDVLFNLGLGQNAFNFSYYGLLNPIILISYFLPFLNMTTYIIVSSIIMYLLSIYLFYRFLRPKFDLKLATLLTTIFMCASPILFHFHRHIMFVNYLPFLIMALINIDNYEKTSNKIFLILNMLSMILSSYYFSVVGILVILIYYIYKDFESSLKEKLKILIPIIISILISGVLIIPSLCSILGSRGEPSQTINLFNLLLPSFNYSDVLYGSYALGLFSITIISIIYLIIRKDKASKFLGVILIVLISFPIFRYLLNGGLYIRSKILIPFIPLIVFIIGIFLRDLFDKKIDLKKIFIVIGILSVLGLVDFNLIYYLDLLLTTIFLVLYYKFKKEYIIIFPLIILSLITIVISNLNEDYITYNEYKTLEQNKEIITEIINNDSNIYRISEFENTLYNVNRKFSKNHYKTSIYSSVENPYYKHFYYNILKVNNNNYNNLIIRDTDNIIFNKLMGVKYVLGNNLGFGYSNISDSIYKNDYALSLGYASNNIYSLEKFNEVGYPYNLKYLLNGIVIDNNYENDTDDTISEYNFDLISKLSQFLTLERKNSSYYFSLEEDKVFTIDLNDDLKDKLLFITINGLKSNDCNEEDISITINSQENSLSCSTWWYHNQNYNFNYLINEIDLNALNISLKKGNYKIDSINIYTMDKKYLDSVFDEMTDIKINDNVLTGKISVTNDDSYMTLSIPYDKNFQIFINGEETELEKTNTAFIGFKISKGEHDIKIIYNSNGKILGILLTLFGLLLFVIYVLKRKDNFVRMK